MARTSGLVALTSHLIEERVLNWLHLDELLLCESVCKTFLEAAEKQWMVRAECCSPQ